MNEQNNPTIKDSLLPGADERERSGLCLGIDYGTKRIGVAISDASWKIAFPLAVVQNGPSNKEKDTVMHEIKNILDEHDIQLVVIGESKDFKNKDNEIMEEVRDFKEALEEETWVETVFEPEMFSTLQASRIQGEHSTIDSSAAAVILQSYLDRIQAKEKRDRIEKGEQIEQEDYQEYQ